MQKLTLEYVKDKIEEVGYKLLSDEYKNNSTKLRIVCDKGHIFNMCWSSFQQGQRCSRCAGNQMLTIEEIKSKTKELAIGYICFSDIYINNHTNLKFRCDKGHEYETWWANFQQGSRCHKCGIDRRANKRRLVIEDVKRETKEYAPSYECLSTKYIGIFNKLKFKCNNGHIFSMSWHNFKYGNRCPQCALLKRANDRRFTIDYIKEQTKKIAVGYECLSNTYVSTSTKLKFRCNRGHEFSMIWNNFSRGIRCRDCSIEDRRIHDEISLQNIEWYRTVVTRYSNENYILYYYQINPNKLKRSYRKYHLDHIYSVIDGFNNNILPQIIASPINLQMLLESDNKSKSGVSGMTKEELFQKYDEFIKSCKIVNKGELG